MAESSLNIRLLPRVAAKISAPEFRKECFFEAEQQVRGSRAGLIESMSVMRITLIELVPNEMVLDTADLVLSERRGRQAARVCVIESGVIRRTAFVSGVEEHH